MLQKFDSSYFRGRNPFEEDGAQNYLVIKIILILAEGFTKGLEDTTLYAEKMYPINFTATRKKLQIYSV